MAETPVEVIIRARNEAQAALNQAIGQMKQLEAGAKSASGAGRQMSALRDAIGQISPAASQAVARVGAIATAAGALGPIVGVAAGVAVALGGIGAAAFVAAKKLGDTVEELDNFALASGTAVGDAQVLVELFERKGLGADTAKTALHRLNVAIGEANPLLAKLGITSRDPMQAMLQLSAAFQTSTDAAARAKVAQELLGRGGRDLLAVIDDLGGSFPALRSEMESTGQLMSGEMLEAGRKFDESWERLTGRFEGQMNRIKRAAADAANSLLDAFTKPSSNDEAIERQARKIEDNIRRLKVGIAEATKDLEDRREKGVLDPGGGLSQLVTGAPTEQIARFKSEIATLERQLGILRGTVREFGQDDLPLFVGEQDAAVDVVARATEAHEKASAAVQKHAERVKELVDLFSLEKAAAEEAIRAAETRERERRKEALRIDVFGGVSGSNQPAPFPENFERDREQGSDRAPTNAEGRAEVLQNWRQFVDQVSSSADILNESLRTVQSSLEAGFNAVFQRMLEGAGNFRDAMVAIFRSMVSAILAQLARLIAFRIVNLLIGGGGLGIGAPADPGFAPLPALRTAERSRPGLQSAVAGGGGLTEPPIAAPVMPDRPATPRRVAPATERAFAETASLAEPIRRASAAIRAFASAGSDLPGRRALGPDRGTAAAATGALPEALRRALTPDRRTAEAPLVALAASLRLVLERVRQLATAGARSQGPAVGLPPTITGSSPPTMQSLLKGLSMPQRESSGGGDTYIIQAINARDAVLSLTQPGGELRMAHDRLELEAAR